MALIKFTPNLLILAVLLLFSSCIKDVDLNRIDEVVIPPTAAIDLVYFTLEPLDFQSSAESPVKFAEDFVSLQFLDDDYIQTGLVGASFTFNYINTFPKKFINTVSFISKNGNTWYSFSFEIPAGSPDNPSEVNYTEIIPDDRIEAIRKSYNLKIRLEMVPDEQPIVGSLQLKSKAFYEFEF